MKCPICPITPQQPLENQMDTQQSNSAQRLLHLIAITYDTLKVLQRVSPPAFTFRLFRSSSRSCPPP